MYVRVVRFTDVDKERVDALLATIDEAGGAAGRGDDRADASVRRSQRTAVVLQYFRHR